MYCNGNIYNVLHMILWNKVNRLASINVQTGNPNSGYAAINVQTGNPNSGYVISIEQ